MSFVYPQYIIVVILATLIWAGFTFRQNQKFSTWIKDHWFFKLSHWTKISLFFQVLGVTLLMLAMLDLRGPEKLIQSQVSTQKTLILIDTSASMFVEDVRPNRFEKTLLLVKHFVKRSAGQKISIAVFSDFQKIIVPFTDDTDLIEARIDSLKDLNLNRGGTSLSLAIQQGVQNFKITEGDSTGNILVFTDAEETDGGVKLSVPENMSVGIVGVGTRKGGPVPMRNSRGEFIRNKTYQGQTVISKLDESFLKDFGEDIPYYKFWVATSYTLPTEEILSFFNRSYQLKMAKNNYRIRPVEAYKILVPAMICLILGYILKMFPTYVAMSLIILISLNMPVVHAQQIPPAIGGPLPSANPAEQEKKEPTKSEETLKLEKKFARGELSDEGINYLATKLLQDGFPKDAISLYSENLNDPVNDKNIKHHFNHASALLTEKEKQVEAINKYKSILDYIEKNPSPENEQIEQVAKLNILKSFKQNQGGGGKNDDKENEDKDKQKSSDKQDSKGKGEPRDKEKKDDNKGDDNKEKKEKPKQDMKRKDEGDKKESKQEKAERQKKLPALLKQLMSDDTKLQKKMIDAKTLRRKASDEKDW